MSNILIRRTAKNKKILDEVFNFIKTTGIKIAVLSHQHFTVLLNDAYYSGWTHGKMNKDDYRNGFETEGIFITHVNAKKNTVTRELSKQL